MFLISFLDSGVRKVLVSGLRDQTSQIRRTDTCAKSMHAAGARLVPAWSACWSVSDWGTRNTPTPNFPEITKSKTGFQRPDTPFSTPLNVRLCRTKCRTPSKRPGPVAPQPDFVKPLPRFQNIDFPHQVAFPKKENSIRPKVDPKARIVTNIGATSKTSCGGSDYASPERKTVEETSKEPPKSEMIPTRTSCATQYNKKRKKAKKQKREKPDETTKNQMNGFGVAKAIETTTKNQMNGFRGGPGERLNR